MSVPQYASLAAVIIGYGFCRVFDFPIVALVGTIGGHQRAADITIGTIIAAIPFASVLIFTVSRLQNPHRAAPPILHALYLLSWLVAGAVMGLLPYSRIGTATHLMRKEASTAPGFLHGLDLAILVGLAATVTMLLIALRKSTDH